MTSDKFYADGISKEETVIESIAKTNTYQSTLTDTDCYTVLQSLEHNIISELDQFRIVKLGSLGNFQVSISSDGNPKVEDVTASDISKSRILFRPGKKLRTLLGNLSY